MASSIQILLRLICVVVLTEAHLDHNKPFFSIPGLQHLARPNPDIVNDKEPIDNNYDHNSWQHHDMGPQTHPDLSDGNIFSYDIHHGHRSFDPYNPFLDIGMDPYFGMGPYDMDRFNHMPGVDYPGPEIRNIFNIPGQGSHSHEHKPPNKFNHPGEKPKQDHKVDINSKISDEKPNVALPTNDQPSTVQDKDPKLEEAANPNIINNPEELPPKTNAINKDELPKDEGKNDDKQVGINEKKDFLLVGSDSNGNNAYLLHENNPNTNAGPMPNANQPGNNIAYVPYNPGKPSNQVYQVVNGQPAPLPTNQLTQAKLNTNGYINGITNTGQPTISTPANQSPNYILVYSNGQVTQIPGVVLNTAPNNVPLQNGNQGTQYILANTLPNNMPSIQNNVPLDNGNPVQGAQYIVANTLPNNMQNIQGIQNPGTNVIYATLPNQGSSGQIYVQMPTCMHSVPNYVCGSGAAVQNPVQGPNNAGIIMPNNGSPSNIASYQPNQMMVAQPVVQIPNSASNGYAQPNMVPNGGQGPNLAVNIPSQGAVLNNPSTTFQQAIQMPVNSDSNGYNQPMVPIEGGSNVAVNVPNQGATLNDQNVQLQPAVGLPDNGVSNGFKKQQAPNQGEQGTNAVVNFPSHDTVVNEPDIDGPVALPANNDAMVLDDYNMSSLGAQPAIMISRFKETMGDKKDEKSKDKKDKSKQKDKKNKDADKSKELTN